MKKLALVACLAVLAGCSGGASGEASGGETSAASSGTVEMPSACEVLKAAGADQALGAEPEYQELSSIENETITNTMCNAVVGGGDKVFNLNLRIDNNPEPRQSGEEQAADIIGTLELKTEEVDLGEHAFWAPSVTQLNVWYREGRVYMVIGGDASKEDTIAFGQRVLAAYP